MDGWRHGYAALRFCGDALKQKEPFVGFRQVEIENLLEEYRDRLDAEKITRAPGK